MKTQRISLRDSSTHSPNVSRNGRPDVELALPSVKPKRDTEPTWVHIQEPLQRKEKNGIGQYVASHLIPYGGLLQLGPGTTNKAVMKMIIAKQKATGKALDLEIMTTNLEILELASHAQYEAPHLFDTTRIVLTGGTPHPSMNCLVGYFAAAGVAIQSVVPDAVLMGVHSLSFGPQFRMMYHFNDELTTQIAYATRATRARYILADHSKLCRASGYDAQLTIEDLLKNAQECVFIFTLPEDPVGRAIMEEQIAAFKRLLNAPKNVFKDKLIALRLIDKKGHVQKEYSNHEGAR